MGQLPRGPFELRLAATLFLLLLGVANFFGAWQVRNFSSFAPAEVARSLAPPGETSPDGVGGEHPISLRDLDRETHHVARELLVQDTHVHVPAYALTAAFLSLLVFGLELGSRTRSLLVILLFAAPTLDFMGLWGAHLAPGSGVAWASLAVAGGGLMGLAYLVVVALTVYQCWLHRAEREVRDGP